MNKKEKDLILAAIELYDILYETRILQKQMFGECPEDEIDIKMKKFNEKYILYIKNKIT